VLYAEPNWEGALCYVPTDPLYAQTASDLAIIGMEEAWAVQSGAGVSPAVVVAVIDSGVEPYHPDLAPALDLANSWNFTDNNANVFDDLGHGTRVAGIVAAAGNNAEGIAGVAFGCTLLSLDVATSAGVVTTADVASAMNWAVARGADVVNMSLRFSGASQTLQNACGSAAAAGVLLVAAAGNENQGDLPVYPASYDSVIGVGGVMDDGTARAPFSNYNNLQKNLVELVAPGSTVFSTIPGSQYNGTYGSGTSFAAPMVSGVAALLKAHYPGQSAAAIRAHLDATCKSVGQAFQPANSAGAGLLDAKAALETPMMPKISVVSVTVDDNTAYDAHNDADAILGPDESVKLVLSLTSEKAVGTNVTATLSTANPSIGPISHNTVSFGAVDHDLGTFNSADPFTTITVSASAVSQPVVFSLALTGDGGYSDLTTFSLQIENVYTPPTIIGTNTTWTKDKTYVITQNTVVMNAATLTIEPGTTIRFDREGGLEVRGGIVSEGTESEQIVFTSLDGMPGGGFDPEVRMSVGGGPATIVIGDADNDGDNDIVTANSDSNNVSLIRWNGSGFDPEVRMGGGVRPLSVVIDDADNDGDNDIVTAYSSNDVSLLRWNADRAEVRKWKGLWIRSTAATASFAHTAIRFASSLDESSVATFTDCLFDRTGGDYGLSTQLGSTPLARCSVSGNGGGDGIRAGSKALVDCVAEDNAGIGLQGGILSGCAARRNGKTGISGASAQGCTAENNGEDGIFTSGTLAGCLVTGNDGWGVSASGDVQDTTATLNGNGISGSNVTSCVARQNTGVGIQTGGTAMGCVAENNGGAGITGNSLTDCTLVGNASGLNISGTAQRCTVAQNTGNGISGGTVDSCSIHHNTGTGPSSPESVGNSWVVGNSAIGVLGKSAPPYSSITNCTIRDNKNSGVKNSGTMTSCNIHDNAASPTAPQYDYEERRLSTELAQVDLSGNYWGPVTTPIMNAHPWGTYYNIPRIYDFVDSTNLCEVKYAGHLTSPATASPDNTAPAFLLSVVPDPANAVNVGWTTFTLTFSEAMEPNPLSDAVVSVSFGLSVPYTANVVQPYPGYLPDKKTWQGRFAVGSDTGDGVNTIRVSNAVSADGFLIPDDTAHTFVIDTTGGGAANNGIALAMGTTMKLMWSEGSKPAGALGYNVRRSELGLPGTYQKINASVVTAASYVDVGVQSHTLYFYVVDLVDADFNSMQWTPPFFGRTESITRAEQGWMLYE
jgi:subtilisin family serine protease